MSRKFQESAELCCSDSSFSDSSEYEQLPTIVKAPTAEEQKLVSHMQTIVNSPVNLAKMLQQTSKRKISRKKIFQNMAKLRTESYRSQYKESLALKNNQTLERVELERPKMIETKKKLITKLEQSQQTNIKRQVQKSFT